jgi:tetratricopeptide (TPR) repeat protein
VNIDRALVEDPRYAKQDLFYPYFHIGEYNMLQQSYDSALYYYNKSLEYATLPEQVAWVYLKNGIIYNFDGRYDKAISILERSLDTIFESGNAEIEANAYIETGYSYHMKMDYDTALVLFNKGITLARQSHFLGLEVEGLKRKTDILYNLKRYPEFSHNILTYNLLKDSLNTINNLNQLSEIVFQHKINTAEEQARHDHYILETKHKLQLLVFYILLILLIATIVVVLLLLNRKNILIKNRKIKEELLSSELDLRNREMTAKVLSQVQKKELMVDIIGKLTDIEMNKKSAKNIHNVIVELRQSIEENSHVDFEYYFVQTHPDFYNNLRIDFPNLTPHELRLCAYLKMNLSTKDIAAISNISPDSARTARSRLRKTLKIQNQDENLVSFLAKY